MPNKLKLKKNKNSKIEGAYFKNLINYFNSNYAIESENDKNIYSKEDCEELMENLKLLKYYQPKKGDNIFKPEQFQYKSTITVEECLNISKDLCKYNKFKYPIKSQKIYTKFLKYKRGILNMFMDEAPLVKAKIDIILGILFNIERTDIDDNIFYVLDCSIVSKPLNSIKFYLFSDLDKGDKIEKIFNKDYLIKHTNHSDIIKYFKDLIDFFFDDNVNLELIKKIMTKFEEVKIFFLDLPKNLAGFTIYDGNIYLTSRLIEAFYDKNTYLSGDNISELRLYEERCEIAIFSLESCIWHEFAHKLMKEYRLIIENKCGAFVLTEEKKIDSYSELSYNDSGSFFDSLLLGLFFGTYTIDVANLFLYELFEINSISSNSILFKQRLKKYIQESLNIKDPIKSVIPCKKKNLNKDNKKITNFIIPGFCAKLLSRQKKQDFK